MRTLALVATLGALSAGLALNSACSNSRGADAQVENKVLQPAAIGAAGLMQSDADIKLAARIRTAILQDSRTASTSDSVTILVRGGTVTLQGRAKDQDQKKAVEAVTRAVPGVENVDNFLVAPE